MTPEELSAWTPVALTVEKSDLAIEWCDLRGVDFREPFFTQTVARWTRGENARPVVRTGFSALLATDGFGTCLEPSGFIFHMWFRKPNPSTPFLKWRPNGRPGMFRSGACAC